MRVTVRTSDGLDLAVDTHHGEGDPVVLVHGFPDTSRVWDELVAELTPAHRVTTYDVRGAGRSHAPRARSGYRLEQLADDLHRVIDLVSPDEPAHVVGHDWGAIGAFEAVCTPEHAERIATFTCISGASLDHAGRLLRRTLSLPRGPIRTARQLARSSYILAFQLPLLPERAFHRGLGARALASLEDIEPREGHPAETLPADGANGVNLYRANLHRLARPVRSTVHVPTTVVRGSHDPFVGADLFDELPDLTPASRLVTLDGGHWLPRTHAPELAAIIEQAIMAGHTRARPPQVEGVGQNPDGR